MQGWAMMAAASLVFATTFPASGDAGSDPLARYRWTSRVLVVVADRADDPRLDRQRALFSAMGAGASERDLVLVEEVGATAAAARLRARLALGTVGFHAVLIGKDGGAKLTSEEPLAADALFPTIDAMPMRRNETSTSRN